MTINELATSLGVSPDKVWAFCVFADVAWGAEVTDEQAAFITDAWQSETKRIADEAPVQMEPDYDIRGQRMVDVEYLADGGETIHETRSVDGQSEAIAEHYRPTSLNGLGAAQPEEDV